VFGGGGDCEPSLLARNKRTRKSVTRKCSKRREQVVKSESSPSGGHGPEARGLVGGQGPREKKPYLGRLTLWRICHFSKKKRSTGLEGSLKF